MNQKIVKICLSLTICLFLIGCKAKHNDISGELGFLHYIGEKYLLLSDMDISGVNLPPGYSEEVDIYVISSRDPGWSGPEVVTRETLPKGSVVTIEKVYECTNCLTFNEMRHVTVSTNDYKKAVDVPIQLYLQEIVSGKHVAKVQ